MPSPAVPARTAHSPPFCMSQRHPPRSATSEHELHAVRMQVMQRHASRPIHIDARILSSAFSVFLLRRSSCFASASLVHTFHMGASQLGLLRRAQPSTTCVEKRLFALCVCSHVPYIWPSCVLISSSVCCRRHVRVWGWGQPSSSSAARTSHAHLARSAPLFASAAQQHAPPPRGPILSELASR